MYNSYAPDQQINPFYPSMEPPPVGDYGGGQQTLPPTSHRQAPGVLSAYPSMGPVQPTMQQQDHQHLSMQGHHHNSTAECHDCVNAAREVRQWRHHEHHSHGECHECVRAAREDRQRRHSGLRRLSVIESDESCSSANGCCDSPYQYYSGEGGHRHRVRSGESRRASHHSQTPHSRQRDQSGGRRASLHEPNHHGHRDSSRHSSSSPESTTPRRRLYSNARSLLGPGHGVIDALGTPIGDRVMDLRDGRDGRHRSPSGARDLESYDVSPRTRVLSRPSMQDVDLIAMEGLRLDEGGPHEVDRGRQRETKQQPRASDTAQSRVPRLTLNTDLASHAELRQTSGRYPHFQAPPEPYQHEQRDTTASGPMHAVHRQPHDRTGRERAPDGEWDDRDVPPGVAWPLPERMMSPTRQHRSVYQGHELATPRLRLAEPRTPGRD
jgi:hypothetical protein